MLIYENIRLALFSLKANKMRALLTMLGIIIGIASVIAIMTVGNSITSYVSDTMSSMGASNITVGLQQKQEEEEAFILEQQQDIIIDDISEEKETEATLRRKQLEEMAKEKPEDFAKLLRTWIAED